MNRKKKLCARCKIDIDPSPARNSAGLPGANRDRSNEA